MSSANVAVLSEDAAEQRSRYVFLTWESVAYLILIAIACVTRFWDLGTRAMMHDEALHVYYSWLLAQGNGYTHDPLSHGPFLFHANALMYLLFGDNDATSRFMPALFGVMLVAMPWLLRGPRHLGRWGALAASVFFLLSPSLLYYTRFIRHDPYTIVGTLLLFIAIVRYLDLPQRRWLVILGLSLGLLYTNHEIVFAIVFLFGVFIYGALLWGRLRPLVPVHILAGIVALLALLTYRRASHNQWGGGLFDWFGQAFPAIPWDRSGNEAPRPTPENQRQFYLDVLTHPLTLILALIGIGFLVGCWLIIRRLTVPTAYALTDEGRPRGWVDTLFAGAPDGSIEAGVRHAWRDKLGLQIALASALIICIVLFTTLFTNLGGIATGTFATDGTLLYWLGQQDVQRGEQPWFYFLLMIPQYELLALAFGAGALVLTLWRGAGTFLGKRPHDKTLTFRLLVAFWFVGIFGALSYAGEKMPWLIVHITLPLILLAASLVGELVERRLAARYAARTGPRSAGWTNWVTPALVITLLALGMGWVLLAAQVTSPEFVRDQAGDWTRRVSQANADRWWQLAIPPVAAIAAIGVAWVLRGGRAAAHATIAAVGIGLLLLQVHAGWRVTFLEGDVAQDTLIYNTTTPDITRMMDDVQALSHELYGDLSIPVIYGPHVNWPLYWYFRNYPNAAYRTEPPVGTDAAIIVLSHAEAQQYRAQLAGYTEQRYVLRWHEPETQIYRNFAIAPELRPGRSAWRSADDPHGPIAIAGSIWSSFQTMSTYEGQQRLWRLVMYREMPWQTINWGYSIFVRTDLLPLYQSLQYDLR